MELIQSAAKFYGNQIFENCMNTPAYSIGIYEKAMPDSYSWSARLETAKKAGYDFIEMSIDESDRRLERLEWSARQRAELRTYVSNVGIPISSLCLSGHRRFPLGSADPGKRNRSLDILKKAINFALDTNIRIILVPGYDVFYEESNSGTEERFLDGLFQARQWASSACVMLALENTEKYIVSIKHAREFVEKLNSIWFQLYGDIGNLVAAGFDVLDELEAGAEHLAGIHIKDALPGKVRNVPLGYGTVSFGEIFRKLSEIEYHGPLMLELLEDPQKETLQSLIDARTWVQTQIVKSLTIPEKE
jgi:L-ribulose-5-phosphate 3-epimerase